MPNRYRRHLEYIVVPDNIQFLSSEVVFRKMEAVDWRGLALLFRRVDRTRPGAEPYILCIGYRQGYDYNHVDPRTGQKSGNKAVKVVPVDRGEQEVLRKYFRDRYGYETQFFDSLQR